MYTQGNSCLPRARNCKVASADYTASGNWTINCIFPGFHSSSKDDAVAGCISH